MSRVFVVNSSSGRHISQEELEKLTQEYPGRLVFPRNRDDTILKVRQALGEGVDQVIALGGDGTVNSVVNGFFSTDARDAPLIRPQAQLVVSNFGTGSDYFKTLSEVAQTKCSIEVDVGEIRFHSGVYSVQRFLNMASVGLIAEIAQKKNETAPWLPSKLRYALPSLQSLSSAKPKRLKIRLDSESFEGEFMAVSISKGFYAGAGMRFGGEVGLGDRLFDITLFRAMSSAQMLLKFSKLYTGKFHGDSHLIKRRSSFIEILSNEGVMAEFDGEVYGETPLSIQLHPQKVRVSLLV